MIYSLKYIYFYAGGFCLYFGSLILCVAQIFHIIKSVPSNT